MTLRTQTALLLTLPLSVGLVLFACSDDGPTGSDDTSDSDSESESGDEMTGDGDPGDGDPSGDGDGDPPCPVGAEGCPCTGGGVCDAGLMCEDGICVPATGDGDGDPGDGDGDPGDGDPGDGDPGDGDPGDGDGDPTGDGDGDPNTCQGDEIIEILAVDADDIVGWEPVMSTLGEGMILSWDDVSPNAYVSWDLDIPCDDDWHVWIRGIDYQNADSFFVLVDGGPMPVPIFELDCTGDPQQQAIYRWKELNWRDPMDQGCTYVEDPWVQTWTAGPHTVTLGYRPQEAYALSRIYVTNTNQPPP